jgi:hypothetical protein
MKTTHKPKEGGDDGVVKYVSAHIDGVDSERVVSSPRSCQSNPETIDEVRRILRLHTAELACAQDPARCSGVRGRSAPMKHTP